MGIEPQRRIKRSMNFTAALRSALLAVAVVVYASAAGLAQSVPPGARSIVPPFKIETPEQAKDFFFPMFKAPRGRYAVSVRWQGNDIVSKPSDYDASTETGFQLPKPLTNWQFGPPKDGRRSTFQAHGKTVGFLQLTADSPWPPKSPPKASKHAVFAYYFAEPISIFTGDSALMLRATVTVPKFVPLDLVDYEGGEVKIPLGTLYFVLEFRDTTNPGVRGIPWSIVMFDSRNNLRARDRLFVDPSNKLMTVTNRLFPGRKGPIYASLARNSAVLTGIPFKDPRVFQFYVTPDDFKTTLDAMASRGLNLSRKLSDYRLASVGIVQEQALQEGDQSEMASTISDFGAYEVPAPAYSGDIQK